MSDYLERTNNGTSFDGSDVTLYGMLALASGLKLYEKTGIKPNRVYTPTYMLKLASSLTGIKYKRGEYLRAAKDLEDDANRMKRLPKQED